MSWRLAPFARDGVAVVIGLSTPTMLGAILLENLHSGKVPVYMRVCARSTRVQHATRPDRYTTSRTEDGE